MRLTILVAVTYLLFSLWLFPPLSLLALAVAVEYVPAASLLFGFLLGIFADLLTGHTVGERSLLYLSIAAVTILYKRKILQTNIWYIIIASLLSTMAEYFLILGKVPSYSMIITPLYTLVSTHFLGRSKKQSAKLKL